MLLAVLPLLIVLVIVVVIAIYMRRRGYSGPGGETIVRCSQGHLFTTVWLPGISFKAVRLGPIRFQRCPVGNHWSFVTPVKQSDLTDRERNIAMEYRDTRIP
jgi:hypothetical protein